MSEIDEIFSSKGKGATLQTPAAASLSRPKKKEKESKKRKRDAEPAHHPSAQLKSLPKTVTDPSTHTHIVNTKRPKMQNIPKAIKLSTNKTELTEESRFIDSRGSSRRRTTEEGWMIYKEDELGIRDEGGDTPLCPFDCGCCF